MLLVISSSIFIVDLWRHLRSESKCADEDGFRLISRGYEKKSDPDNAWPEAALYLRIIGWDRCRESASRCLIRPGG
jgi:hypothetical protein